MPDGYDLTKLNNNVLIERILRVVRNADPNECYNWTGVDNPRIKFYGKQTMVRRLMYAVREKGWPTMPWKGRRLYMVCGNAACVNPHHIKAAEVREHNRGYRGRPPKLTADDRALVVALYNTTDLPIEDIAEKFQVSVRTIYRSIQ